MRSPPNSPVEPALLAPLTEVDLDLGRRIGAASSSGTNNEVAEQPGQEADATHVSPGKLVLHYEIIRELGRGATGQVFLARDTRLGRKVAIKMLRGLAPRTNARFLKEARITARCQHENIVVVHDVGESEGWPFIVLEYLEGRTLRSSQNEKALSPEGALRLLLPVVRALAHAHSHGIVHLDLKPDNIFVTQHGAIKVLDFGIARAHRSEVDGDAATTAHGDAGPPVGVLGPDPDLGTTSLEGGVAGTRPYMAPEQWTRGTIDARTDIWAVGLILYELLAGRPLLAAYSATQLLANATLLDEPLPFDEDWIATIPVDFARILRRCLHKRAQDRFPDTQSLLEELAALGAETSRAVGDSQKNPYPGLLAFGEMDAMRFFGRDREIDSAVHHLRSQPLLALMGTSGAGKSSLVQAGIIPALRAEQPDLETLTLRPGREPLLALAQAIAHCVPGSQETKAMDAELAEHAEKTALPDTTELLTKEPGVLGTWLRRRARSRGAPILLFIDQFEELYTLGADAAHRQAFEACLVGAADDASSPLRVVIALRSDFLDHVAENPTFLETVTHGLTVLAAPRAEGLRQALLGPLDGVGYQLESERLIDEIQADLATTTTALPLLQFSALQLWLGRDRKRHILTESCYREIGGVTGALAAHADQVIDAQPAQERRMLAELFRQLVTVDGTRALMEVSDLVLPGADKQKVIGLVDYLIRVRLVVAHQPDEVGEAAVELIHESLIAGWPRLQRWLEAGREDSLMLEQLRQATGQWHTKGRPQGLLWRGDVLSDARRWRRRFQGKLSPEQEAFIDVASRHEKRASIRRRLLMSGSMAVLLLVTIAAIVALIWIRSAERSAKREATRSRAAQQEVQRQLEIVRDKERERQRAKRAAAAARAEAHSKGKNLASTRQQLIKSNARLSQALKQTKAEHARAERALISAKQSSLSAQKNERDATNSLIKIKRLAEAEARARARLEQLLKLERRRNTERRRQRSMIATDLP